jgi:hypothetical protein
MLGRRNSGKGLLTQYLLDVCACYAKSFDCKNLVSTKTTSSDQRQNNWQLDFYNYRLLLANEYDNADKVMSGTKIKQISSGGDPITGRRLYETDDTLGRFVGKFVGCMNDLVKADLEDATETQVTFATPFKYVPVLEEGHEERKEKLMNDDLKKWVDDDEKKFVFLMYMLEAPDSDYKKSKTETKIVNRDLDQLSVKDFLINNFEFTKNKDDFIPAKDIKAVIKELNVSMYKIRPELERFGCFDGKKKIGKKLHHGWFGLKIIEDDVDEINDY